ncbi:MAG TPA: ABC transporter ATP-binding protein [Steroidobacteraceae bacterium]|nr:ABC transporter ATP-binding protein [Steroidobacteraceae bacterium]
MGSLQSSLSAAASAAAPAIRVEAVTRRFSASVVAVDRVTLDVAHGELLCLLGPSGSGKTTLLRIIGGFETPDSGRVLLLDEDVTQRPAAERRTNMVFQNHALFPHLNVRDNIAFGPRMRKVAEAEIAQRIPRVLERVRLSGFETRQIDQLSGGQRQRVAIARAIINDPAVLLLDEPLGALDLRLRMELQTELRHLQRSLGSPFVVVTHDQHEAMAMADRIAVMKDGVLEQIGTPQEVYHRPASLFVAQFIGHTTVIHGTIDDRSEPGRFRVVANGAAIPCQGPAGLQRGQTVALSVREEVVRIGPLDRPLTDVDFSVEAVVVDRTFLGSLLRLSLRVGELALSAELRAEEAKWAIGERVRLGWQLARVPVFATGHRDGAQHR